MFGARGTGKSFFLKNDFISSLKDSSDCLYIDLLDPNLMLEYSRDPMLLEKRYLSTQIKPKIIIIDEIQKVTTLLDVIHKMIESYKIKFILTGSSARKLKREHGNMLAGRAILFSMHPLTHLELGNDFDLHHTLRFGQLPKIFSDELKNSEIEKQRYLKTYTQVYLKEEINEEQIVRTLAPFQRFLEVAAQMSGEILNYSAIGREAKLDDKTVQRYFDILEQTMIGIYLPAFHKSVRKQQINSPKFYFFDIGVLRTLRGQITIDIHPSTYEYGKLFEHFVILEIHRLNQYYEQDYKLFYLKTKDGKEIDLIIIKPDSKCFIIEIKSGEITKKEQILNLFSFTSDFKHAEFLVMSQNKEGLIIENDNDNKKNINVMNWRDGLTKIGLRPKNS